jgi:uncharacterized protein with von Willebrand factor type A (vWA) domain
MLLKAKTKRRRSKAEIIAETENELARLREEEMKDQEIDRLRKQLELKSNQAAQMQQSQHIVDELLRTGQLKVNEKGQYQMLE